MHRLLRDACNQHAPVRLTAKGAAGTVGVGRLLTVRALPLTWFAVALDRAPSRHARAGDSLTMAFVVSGKTYQCTCRIVYGRGRRLYCLWPRNLNQLQVATTPKVLPAGMRLHCSLPQPAVWQRSAPTELANVCEVDAISRRGVRIVARGIGREPPPTLGTIYRQAFLRLEAGGQSFEATADLELRRMTVREEAEVPAEGMSMQRVLTVLLEFDFASPAGTPLKLLLERCGA